MTRQEIAEKLLDAFEQEIGNGYKITDPVGFAKRMTLHKYLSSGYGFERQIGKTVVSICGEIIDMDAFMAYLNDHKAEIQATQSVKKS